MRAKVLVVGGGIVGVSVALAAARRCHPLREPVVLLERADLAAGVTGRSGAILRQHYADPVVAAMARDSLREFASFEARTARPIGFERTGVLTLAGPERPEWVERLERNAEMLGGLGIRFSRVGAPEIRELLPGVRVADGTVGTWEPDGGVVDPVRTVHEFAALARTYGVSTRLGVEATEVVVEDGRIARVETTRGPVEAELVVVCAGPWTRRLLARAGIDLPLRNVRPETHFVGLPQSYREPDEAAPLDEVDLEDPLEELTEQLATGPASLAPTRSHAVLIDLEKGFYARCESETRRARIGRTDYDRDPEVDDPDDYDAETSPETKAWMRSALESRLPVYRKEPDVGEEVALYTLSPDAQALLGPLPGVEGLYVAAGFSGHGFKLAPAVGEGLAQMMLGERISAFDPEVFAPERFVGAEVEWSGAFGL